MFSFNELNVDEDVGVALFGERTVTRRGVRVTEPAYGLTAVRGFLQHVGRQDDAAMVHILKSAGVSGPGIELFASMKTVIRTDDEAGGKVYADVRVPGVADDHLSLYAESTEQFGVEKYYPGEIVDDRRLTYKLNSIFNDATVADKLQISEKRIQVAKRLVITDPAAAARSLTEYVRAHGFPNSRVVAGDFAKSAGRAKVIIRQFADLIEYKDCMAPAKLTPSTIRITYDGMDDGPAQWTVIGPIKYATECRALYELALHHGPNYVMFMLGVETAMLSINIMDEVTNEYYTGSVYGYSSLAGIKPTGASYPSELTAEQKIVLSNAGKKVSPIFVGEAVVGSAVQVSDRHLILNEHTVESIDRAGVDAVLCGEPLVESRSVSHDICMVKRSGIAARWLLRDPDVGERVVLCYSVGDQACEYTEVLRVNSVTGEHLILSSSEVLRRGASGAAVVALRDGALLGVFSTIRARDVICSAFSSMAFRSVTDLESVYSDFPVTPGSEVNRTYDHMVRRGLLSFLEGINVASASLYAVTPRGRKTVGTIANWSGQWTTTVDPDSAQLTLSDGQMLSFRSVDSSHVAVKPPPILSQLPNVRAAQPGERVFAFVKAGDEVALTPMRSVVHCKSDVRQFSVEDFGESEEPMSGGLIVAERDAAVLGMFVDSEVDAFGTVVARCVSFLSVSSRPASVAGGSEIRSFDSSGLVDEFRRTFEQPKQLALASSFGKTLIESVVTSVPAKFGISDVARRMRAVWHDAFDQILLTLGWSRELWVEFAAIPPIDVASAYLALAFTREPAFFLTRITVLLTEFARENNTPTVAEFPFPASQVACQNRSASTDSADRLRELEDRVKTLSQRLESVD